MYSTPRTMEQNVQEAIMQAVHQSCAGLLIKNEDGEPGIGSGCLVRFKGLRCILTAHHVIKYTPQRELQFWLPTTSIAFYEPPGPILKPDPVKQVVPTSLKFRAVHYDEDLDCALLIIDEAEKTIPDFCIFSDVEPSPADLSFGHTLLLTGIPRSRIRRELGQVLIVRTAEFVTIQDSTEYKHRSFDPSVHFLTDYFSSGSFSPHGFSGAAVWANRKVESALWIPKPAIVGMQLMYIERDGFLIMLKIDVILNWLKTIADASIEMGN